MSNQTSRDPQTSNKHLLYKLCQHVSELTSDELPPLYNLTSSILASNLDSAFDLDEFHVSEKIKRKLKRDGNEAKILQFPELHRQLQNYGNINDRKAVLTFLLDLHKTRDQAPTPRSNDQYLSDFSKLSEGLPAAFTNLVSNISDVEVVRGFTMSNLNINLSSSIPKLETTAEVKIAHSHADGKAETLTDTKVAPNKRTFVSGSQPTELELDQGENTELCLCKDLLFALQGIDGAMIKYSSSKERFVLDNDDNITLPMRDYVHRLAELGWLYRQVFEYCERNSQSAKPHLGMIGHSLVAAVRDELNEYYRLISVMEAQLRQAETSETSTFTFRRMFVWLIDPMHRFTILAWILYHCKGKRDVEILNTLHIFTQHGDEIIASLASHKLSQAIYPLYRMILEWLHTGHIYDPFDEFFIVTDTLDKQASLEYKFRLRQNKLPSFISQSFANKILSAGEQLYYLRSVLAQDTELSSSKIVKDKLATCKVTSLVPTVTSDSSKVCRVGDLEGVVNTLYKECSEQVLHTLLTTHQLVTHLHALRRYLLLGQGDFIRHLMDLLEIDLTKPASQLYLHNLISNLELAVRDTIAQYDHADVLKRLDVELLEATPGDTGWDVFKLDYKVDGPISSILTRGNMLSYFRLFTFLWRVKRVEYGLASMWKAHTTYQKQLLTHIPELTSLLHTCHLLQSAMIHFIQELQHYVAFEVVECAWANLINSIDSAKHLGHITQAHTLYLDTLLKGCFLDKSNKPILTQLRAVMDVIVQVQKTQDKMYQKAARELERRLDYHNGQVESEKEGTWGLTEEKVSVEMTNRKTFNTTFIPSYRSNIRVLSKTYHDMVEKFLLLVHDSKDDNLKFLAFRINFNNYYNYSNIKF